MAKFIMGLLVGLTIGALSATYFSDKDLNILTEKARSALSRHVPIND
jgi:hypothetical protein